jgi:ferric-dicitrate binding protein FerR (iron transport regulator)
MDFKFILKKINNSLSKDEESIFNKWYNESSKHRLYFKNVEANYNKKAEKINNEKAWNKIQKRIYSKPRKTIFWKYTFVAAVAALLIFIPFSLNNPKTESSENPDFVKTIKPGVDKAILTLEDGTNIVLEKGKKHQTKNSVSNGEVITYKSNNSDAIKISYNYLTIPRGGKFFVELEDGSKVWLNSESKLKFPVNFTKGQTRTIELVYGEGYFEISPSTNHNGVKFKVITKNQEVEVLGTKFNIKAYQDESFIYTTLVEGKVSVEGDNNKLILKPNEQVVFGTDKMEILQVNSTTETSWVKGVFSFKDMRLKNIMQVLSRWYDVDVTFLNKDIENELFTGVIGKELSMEEILKIIKSVNNVNYEIINNAIIFK